MHERYAKDGLVCMSVSVDQPEEQPAALKFLKAKHAAFANFLLDEPPKVWQDHFDINGPPAVFVYDQRSNLAGRFDADKEYSYADVEKLVKRLLNQ